MRRITVGLALTVIMGVIVLQAQDFRRSYELSPGGQIVIINVLGDIKVTGYKGTGVEVVAFKKGPERDLIEIADNSFGTRIDLHPVYPKFHSGTSSVDFEVKVPDGARYNFSRLSTFSGKIEVANVRGRLRAENVRGDVAVKDVHGLISAASVSGNVRVEIDHAAERNNMRFSSISGDINVQAPADLDALIDMSSQSGLLRTDFPIEVQEQRYGPGRSARGKLGSGMQIIFISSVSGRVNLVQK
jgi:hypothetical protein